MPIRLSRAPQRRILGVDPQGCLGCFGVFWGGSLAMRGDMVQWTGRWPTGGPSVHAWRVHANRPLTAEGGSGSWTPTGYGPAGGRRWRRGVLGELGASAWARQDVNVRRGMRHIGWLIGLEQHTRNTRNTPCRCATH
jgi:hypothetical protein